MDNLKQNRRGEFVAQRYGMVKIPHAELGYTRLNCGIKGSDL